MATKEFLGQKLTYMTNPQKKYLEILKTTKVSYNSFKKLLETSLENLNKPEASWTRADLIASGVQFPSPGSIITGRTVFIDPNNTFLVGYKAFLKMVSSYSFMAAYTQTVVEDTVRCKEYLYLTAYCQKCLCGWPDDDELHVATCHVSSQQLHTFLMAIIADVKADFITDLGSMLMLPERNIKDSILISRGEATIFLATQDYEKAYRSAEHLQSVLKKAKRSSSMWMYYAQGIKAVIEKAETSLNAALCTFINECRKVDDPEAPELLNYYATGLAKLAVKNGLQVTIDTMDCPQALIQPVQMDYSRLELPRPKYGFPWERETEESGENQMALQYSTKRLDKELEQENVDSRIAIYQKSLDRSLLWLEKAIQEHKHDQLIEECLGLRSSHFQIADWLFASGEEHSKVKRHYYLAALASAQAYRLVRAGFPHDMREWAGPYNFKKNNLNFTKDAILANDLELALSIAGEDTVERLLILEEYEKAQKILPQDPAAIGEETALCCWAIAHQDQSVFNDALKERIKMLRRQGSHMVTVLDSWGLALIQLARRRGMTCDLNVAELPWKRLDDEPTDTTGLRFPFEAELREIIREKEAKD